MHTNTPTIIDWISAIGNIATPILLVFLAGIGWTIQKRIEKSQAVQQEMRERARKLEEALREDRLAVYNGILEPFIIPLTKDEGIVNDKTFKGKTKTQVANEKILSLSYRQTAFKLSLFASDEVVRSYNNIMQFFFMNATSTTDKREASYRMFELFGKLLLEIHKSIGNEKTALQNMEMIEWLISDIRELKREFEKS